MKVYFDSNFIHFFYELALNNSKEYFDSNKTTYLVSVKQSFENLVQDLLDLIDQIDCPVKVKAKDCIFRINRDVRFSSNKSPYKKHVSAILAPNGKKGVHFPSYYLEVSDEGVTFGGGAYFLEPPVLNKVREFICQNYQELEEIIVDPKFTGYFHEMKGDKNKILPKGLKGLESDYPIIFNKQYYFMKTIGQELVTSDKLFDVLKEGILAARSFNNYFRRAISE